MMDPRTKAKRVFQELGADDSVSYIVRDDGSAKFLITTEYLTDQDGGRWDPYFPGPPGAYTMTSDTYEIELSPTMMTSGFPVDEIVQYIFDKLDLLKNPNIYEGDEDLEVA